MLDPVKAALEIAQTGSVRGADPGRVDTHEISVPAESYVVPSDVVSFLGQGNTAHGHRLLESVFPPMPAGHAAGGAVSKVPVIVASGEYIIHPAHVAKIGGGDLKKGHNALREWVGLERAKHIATLKKLPKPARG